MKAMLQPSSVFCMERVLLVSFGPERNQRECYFHGLYRYECYVEVHWIHGGATKGRSADPPVSVKVEQGCHLIFSQLKVKHLARETAGKHLFEKSKHCEERQD